MTPILLSLAHFCDKHGPKVVLVTQAGNIGDLSDGNELLVPNYSTDSYCESCLLHFPKEDTDGVRSMRSFMNDIPFVTTQYSTIRYQLLSYITKKAFSEESMIYDGSPLVFFDDTRGLNLVIGFKLYDENARGNERRYSFIFTVDSKDQDSATKILSDHWVFMINSFTKMIDFIKLKHKQKLDHSKKGTIGNPFISTDYLKVNKLKTATNLLELTNDPMLFVRIHKWNSFVINSLISASSSP